jgi:Na+/proline symporter
VCRPLLSLTISQAYWQRAIASQPASCVKAFLIGGLSWFAIPFCFATTLGLAAVALSHGPNPLISLTAAEVSAGLAAPKAAGAVLGQSGAVAMLVGDAHDIADVDSSLPGCHVGCSRRTHCRV